MGEISIGTILMYAALGIGGLVVIGLLFASFFTVEEKSAALVERFGKFARIARAGLNLKIPLIDRVAGEISLKVRQLDVAIETKTLDNVFVKAKVTVQYTVLPEKVYDAYYKLEDEEKQIEAYVFDVVRAEVPKLKLDDVFAKKDEIGNAVKRELQEVMDDFGFSIVKALVTDIDPDEKVKLAMNEINAAQRLRIAAEEKGEADRILKVKAAEAEAQSKKLQGQGIADQRKAIIDGLKESIDHLREATGDANADSVLPLILLTQYFDTLKELGLHASNNTIMLPHGPGALQDIWTQMSGALIASGKRSGALGAAQPAAGAKAVPPRP